MEYEVLFNDNHFEVKLTGPPNVKDCDAYFEYLTSHKNWLPGSLVLSDETELEIVHLTTADIVGISEVCRQASEVVGTARFAAIVPEDLQYGLQRMLQGHVELKWDATVVGFRSRKDALSWLLES